MTQTLLTIFIPSFMVLTGILLNRNEYARIDARIGLGENRLEARMSSLENRLHSDMMSVIGKLTELEVRVARLEGERQGN